MRQPVLLNKYDLKRLLADKYFEVFLNDQRKEKMKKAFIKAFVMTVLGISAALNLQADSNDAIFKDFVEQNESYRKEHNGSIETNYLRSIIKKPFDVAMTEPDFTADKSLFRKLYFYDTNDVLGEVRRLLVNYIKDTKIPGNKRQDAFNFMLSDSKSYKWLFHSFYDKKYYDAKSKEIIKDAILKKGYAGSSLMIIDAADMYEDHEIMAYIKELAAKTVEWNGDGWYALLLLARNGDVIATDKLIEIAKMSSEIKCMKNVYIPNQFSFVPNQKIVDYLIVLLDSNEYYFNGEDAIPKEDRISYLAALSLSLLIEDFPKVNINNFTDVNLEECKEWLKLHKPPYSLRKRTEWPRRTRYMIFGI